MIRAPNLGLPPMPARAPARAWCGPVVLAALALLAACGSFSTAPPAGTTPFPGCEGALTTYTLTSPVAGIASRNVTVLLPPGYKDAASGSRVYSVLYLQDGNNCLDQDPFGHGGRQVHTTATDLISRGLVAPLIVAMIGRACTTSRAWWLRRREERRRCVSTSTAAPSTRSPW